MSKVNIPTKNNSILKTDIELANKINELINVDSTLVSDFNHDWNGSIELRKFSNGSKSIIMYVGDIGSVVTSGTIITNIPEPFRPSGRTALIVAFGNTPPFDSHPLFWLDTNGNIIVRSERSLPSNRKTALLNINQIYF